MTSSKWEKIVAAKELLGLDDQATLKQIKSAYRRMSKRYHPDLNQESKCGSFEDKMHVLNDAYNTLLEFCENYTYSLVPDENQSLDAEDWWFDRFGEDPLWGKKKS